MKITPFAKQYHETMFPNRVSTFATTDPDFITIFDNFAFDEVIQKTTLKDDTRMRVILAALIGCQGIDEFKMMLEAALHLGVTAIELKEIVYQATAYVGIGKVYPYLHAVNDFLVLKGYELPLPSQQTTDQEQRLSHGIQAQVDIFGEEMRLFYCSDAPDRQPINQWLAANCFGDFYTRKGLSLKERELMTFCYLMAQGGCEAQLQAHCKANIRLGNSRAFLLQVIYQCLPYIGYPRSLQAIASVQEVTKEEKES